ncbi:hypothetical protein DRW03_17270 [Corallococcus sp. H22C18031201]|uniref:exopolysaccharide export protein EpsX n=1 Tax=Citreicoccus inhibens TaxID=2849499 RepID=UPI000E70A203|nr:exopolysaccharide export protein EpsX [Citreicoccus inhibens]MBU8897272.1 hypothetical protein [Citreicoccus inhibens]RJS21166.1 hypothetical protein DRW03_17270 [Corallococcus sp. H22C18031201]
MLGAVLTSAWLEVASASVSYGVAVRADSRVRSLDTPATQTPATTPSITGDAELTPSLSLLFRDGGTQLQAEYAPRLSLREVTQSARTEVQHVGRLVGDWRADRGLTLHGSQEFVLGRVDLLSTVPVADSPTRPVGDGPLQPIPQGGSVYFLSSLTTLGTTTTWLGRGLGLSASAAFAVSGGLNGGAREAVPLQYGPRAQAALGWALAQRQVLSTAVGATDTRFSTGAHATVLTLTEGWNWRMDRRTSLEAGMGVGVAQSLSAEGLERTDVLPDLTVAMGYRIPSREYDFTGRLSAHVTPFVDRLTGQVYPRADVTASGTWMLGPRARVSATGGTAFAVGGATADRLILGGLGASYAFTRWVSVESEARTAWSRSPGVETARFQWSASLGLAVRQAGIL